MKIAAQDTVHARQHRNAVPAILFTVSRRLFAVTSESVQEIRSTDSVAGASSEFDCPDVPKVRHTFERAHRQYYVVNGCAHFGLPSSRPTLVLILRQLRIAVLVDRIERMTELPAICELPLGFAGEERRWYRGLTYLDDHVIPVVNPRGFLTAEEFRRIEGVPQPLHSTQELEGAVSK